MREAIYYFLFPDLIGEALVMRGAFLATALAYYLGYRFHKWACGRGQHFPTPAGIPIGPDARPIHQPIPNPYRFDDARPAPADGEVHDFDAWEYVRPEGPNWPGSDNVTLNPRKYEK